MEYRYDTHVHTSEASRCAKDTAAAQVRAYKERGYTGIIITDHFVHSWWQRLRLPWKAKMWRVASGYVAAKKEGKKCGLDVFFAWEISYYDSDFLTYGLDMDFLLAHPNLEELTFPDYCDIVRKSGGFIVQAHPYRDMHQLGNRSPVDPKSLDAIEVYNSSDSVESNEKALAFAKKHNLPMQAGSDSHSVNHSPVSGVMLKNKADSIFDIIDAIKAGNAELIC